MPLADLDDIVFGGWDIFDDNCYEAAKTAGVLEAALLDSDQGRALGHQADVGRVRSPVRQAARRPERQEGQEQEGSGRVSSSTTSGNFKAANNCDRLVLVWCGSTEIFLTETPAHQYARGVREGPRGERPVDSVEHDLRVRGDQRGSPLRQRGAEPERRHSGADASWPRRPARRSTGKDLKTGQTLIKTIIAPGLKARLLGIEGWYSTNILGNRDGEVLDDPESFKTKEESKKSVLDYILQPNLYPDLYNDLHHVVRINYYKPRGDAKEGWDNIDLVGWLGYQMQLKINFLCRDSILAAPIVLDVALFLDLAKRAGMSGIQEWLSFYFKSPMHAPGLYPEHDLFIQLMKLKNTLRYMQGEELITHLGREYYD